MAVEREIVYCADAGEWERWLDANGESSPGVRLAIAKKGAGVSSVSYSDAVDVGLCFGWIDAQKGRLDERYYVQLFTPRRPGSIWSQVNRERVQRLTDAGRMRPAGEAAVEQARANGRWEAAYASQGSAEVPADLAEALAASPEAAELFARLDSANRYAIIFRIGNVKRAETRARKIADYVAMLARGETIHPRKP
ncbi:YdeI/OmpD-associated family protein [Cryobacterium tepidiphilum]|uniref:Bacteriocin-protection protein n=1 Tax=Cryobacterium tepidiphilum TaxID=2486026 RepID=A0A3M8LPF5_9MICO|nr:YdeI/OmpD-associated family protein [Cryobacterium tepidiphilum]RNE67363.1 bacteriocin-protection protein [Cryobacterium tepidiphilum]